MCPLSASLPARQRLAGGSAAPRHRHRHGYAALVLEGDYVEAGDSGRRAVSPGDVVLHGAFEAHANQIGVRGARVLNLPLPGRLPEHDAFMRVADPDRVARIAERDIREALACLMSQLEPTPAAAGDWRDALAAALRADPGLVLRNWARDAGLAAATVSRGFREAFGVTPVRYRAEARVRQAWRRLGEARSLAELALDAGFADQAHMTRGILAMTGRTPGDWRRSNRFKMEAGRLG